MKKAITIAAIIAIAALVNCILLAQVTNMELRIEVKDLRHAQIQGVLAALGVTNIDASACLTIHVNCHSGTAIIHAAPDGLNQP